MLKLAKKNHEQKMIIKKNKKTISQICMNFQWILWKTFVSIVEDLLYMYMVHVCYSSSYCSKGDQSSNVRIFI